MSLSRKSKTAFFPQRLEVGLDTGTDTVVQQHFKDECDVNKIMARFKVSGQLPQVQAKPAEYLDCSLLTGYQESLHIVEEARRLFYSIPSEIRSRFDNNPQRFVDFASDPANLPQLVELGLAKAPPAPPALPDPPAPGGGK